MNFIFMIINISGRPHCTQILENTHTHTTISWTDENDKQTLAYIVSNQFVHPELDQPSVVGVQRGTDRTINR
jgi:glycerol-3-phosphate dehydrogenase